MTINIQIGVPDKLATNVLVKNSAFIACDYDSEVVSYLKGLSTRVYHPDTKAWETPIAAVSAFVNKFTQHEFIIEGIYSDNTSSEELVEIPADYAFKTSPYGYQRDGVAYALTKNKFLLGDQMGLGKSKQIIDWACCLKKQGKLKRALIICGVNSLKYNWKNEVATHSNESAWIIGTRYRKNGNAYEGSSKDKLADLDNLPESTFLITNIETMRSGAYKEGNRHRYPFADKINELVKRGEISLIAIDEAHVCKNPSSQQGRATLKTSAPYMVAMTGTPIMNKPLDLYVPLKWLGYDDHSYFAFKQHYCTLGGYGGAEVVGYKNLHEIREILDQMMLRRLKDDVLDLPEKIHKDEIVEMTPKQGIIYKEVLNQVRSDLHKISFSDNPLAMLIKLRQATGYTGILSDTVAESAKLDRLEEIVEELAANGEKCVIFSNWEMITSVVVERLKKYNPAYITGKVKTDDRMNEVNRFQTDDNCKVIIGTMGAMGTGLTLTASQTVIFLDEPWTQAVKSQCEDRCHRIGTKGSVQVITLACENTIDQKIHEIVYKKGLLSDMLIDGKGGKIDMKIINELLS